MPIPSLKCIFDYKSRFKNKNTWAKIKCITKVSDTALHGKIKMLQEKSAYFADFEMYT